MHIDVTNEQSRVPVDQRRLRAAIGSILADAGIKDATISVALVDDPTIHELNRRYLDHDYPTDVLSFVLEEGPGTVEGEVIVSGDTAARSAPGYGWQAEDELLLYVIHGTLHLVGYDDKSPADAARMRQAESRYLAQFGLAPRDTEPRAHHADARHPQLLGEGNPS